MNTGYDLNIHRPASLYEAFLTTEATRLADRLASQHPPKHDNWRNQAAIALGLRQRQDLDRRGDRRGTTADARITLQRRYPAQHD